jgi:Protein of unknown function (DUF4011)/AAA domain/REase_MTES_1575/Protein of unknown function (DUF3320)
VPGITIEATPVLSYAMAHNGIPAVSRLVIDGVDADARAARLLLSVSDATGPLATSQELLLDLAAGEPVVLTDLGLTLDPAAMLQVEEQRPGEVRATLEIGGAPAAGTAARTTVLAAQQWLATPPVLALELLAAFVMPNHPAVGVLMSEVADRLAAVTGSAAVQGYQAGPERVDEIVEAVFAAMQARRIRYAEPPASWADVGQKVRTPGEVLDGRVGTCLDTVVTMAAALEQAGIRPLLWITEGHAFLGWWREEASLGSIAELDPAAAINQVDLNRIGLLEATALTGPASFADARRMPMPGPSVGIVDVHEARTNRIVPLPARTRDADGVVRVTVYTAPSAVGVGPLPAPPAVGSRSRTAEPARVARWKNALLDLSLRNRLLNFTARSALSVTVPDGGIAELEDILHSGRSVVLRPSDDLAQVDQERGLRHGRELPQSQLAELLSARHTVYVDSPGAAYQSRLRGLAYRARTVIEETGANNLYLSLGTLVWELDHRALRSPLVLVPVRLRPAGRGGHYRLALDDTGSSTPNYCLLEKLRQVHGLPLPGLADPAADGAGIDVDSAFASVRRALAEHGLPYRVEPTVDIALLQFAKFRLWKDLDENWSTFAANPLVAHLIETPTDAFADPVRSNPVPDLDGLAELCPIPADGSQLRAIADAISGRTFVLEGPPGTGKSQTITNLLVRAVAEGKRVLFVAEKRAALDVVQRRLDEIGMSPLSLDLHDKGSKPATVREQISSGLGHAVVADVQGHQVETAALRSARQALTRYHYRLYDRNAAGFSLYEGRDAELAYGDEVAPMPLPESLLTGSDPGTIDRLRRLFGTLPEVAYPAHPGPRHPWGFVDHPSTVDFAAAARAARRFDTSLPALPEVLRPALDTARDHRELDALAAVAEAGLPLFVLDEARTPRWSDASADALGRIAAFVAMPHPGLETVTPAVLELPVEEIDAAARAAAASSFFGRRKRLVAVRDRLTPVLRPGATVKPKRLTDLTAALVALRGAVRELAGSVSAIPGLALPPGWNPFTADLLTDRITHVRRLAALVDPGRGPFAVALRSVPGAAADPAAVRQTATAAAELAAATGTTSFAGWAGASGLLAAWRSSAADRALADPRLDSLRRWLDLLRHLEPLRADHLDAARAAVLSGALDPDDASRSYEAALARSSVAERLHTTGLSTFDPAAHERSIARFAAASRSVRRHLVTLLPQQVLARRGFDPRATGGRVGELSRQLSRQRGGLKVRALMARYGDVITRALPCVLVSPESLARFFPAQAGLFDIVVFDEASQIRVADAIGAMGRARSVVVVGDSKQMPPTSVAESSIADDDPEAEPDAGVVDDEESILTECVQARVERHRLTWHYRSQDELLIAFSNVHYYDGALSTFPAPDRPGTGVSLVRVDGRFLRTGPRATFRTNPVEAEAVVAEIVGRFAGSPEQPPSIGVVTFNAQQRAYIEGLLRDTGDERLLEALEEPDGLFVKNLENVQGDERDVVLFSTAFSVNERGVLPLNFGPLNRAGGERRLNVAVTRARRQVIVYSSFDPGQLRTEQTASVGLRHLRTYLEMAQRGASVLPANLRRPAERDRHRDQIAARLRDRGLDVRAGIGLSDFALDLVIGAADAAVLLDGRSWMRRMTARDRDALPREVLGEVLGWPAVERVWLPEWLADPEGVLDRLHAAARGEGGAGGAATGAAGTAAELVPPATPPGAAPDSAGPAVAALRMAAGPVQHAAVAPVARDGDEFVPWAVRQSGTVEVLDALPGRAAGARVGRVLAAIVAVEGPVHVDRLARLAANAFGLERVAESRRAAILRQLPPTLRVDDERVVWPEGVEPRTWTRFRRTPSSVDRPLAHVPLREIVNAMVVLAGDSAGMSRAELRRAALGVFGGRRLTTGLSERLDLAVDLGVRTGRLIDADGTLRPA